MQAGLRLALISASAGSGKTCLLSAWASQGARSFAWLSLDEGDNDPQRFWTYIIAALRQVRPEIGKSTLQWLASPQAPPSQTLFISLLNELVLQAEPLVLVLDDYHAISNADIHSGITFLVEHLPPYAALAISTRADPPLPVSRLRARNQLIELRDADLSFSLHEAEVFLKENMSLDLSGADIDALEARTEGWIAGLQLAALALKAPFSPHGRPDSHEFITAFSGSHHYILDYLAEEVFSRQSEPVKEFLMKTSILERMCAPLCEEILRGRGEGIGAAWPPTPSPLSLSATNPQAILEYLDHSNLFTFPLDSEHCWYRYHRLFADLLANRLREALPAREIQALHCRASDWLADNGFLDPAIQHAVAGRDYERAASLVEASAHPLIYSGQINTVKSWLAAFPPLSFETHPRLKVYRVWIDILQGRSDLSDRSLQEKENMLNSLPPSPENERLRVELMVILARIVAMAGNSTRAIHLAEAAQSRVPKDDLASLARLNSALALAYQLEGRAAKARRAYQECLRQAFGSGYYSLAAHTIMMMTSWQAPEGHLHAAARAFQSIVDLKDRANTHPSQNISADQVFFPAGQGYIGLASVYLEWNDLETAENYLAQGLELCSQAGLDGVYFANILKSRLRQARGDLIGALDEIQQTGQAFHRKDPTLIGRQIQVLLAMGDIEEAARLAAPLEQMLIRPAVPPLPLLVIEFIEAILARVYLAQGKVDKSLYLLDELQSTAVPGERFGSLIQVELLQALAYHQRSPDEVPPAALECLACALDLAEPEGYILLFLEEGPALIPLLNAFASGRPGRRNPPAPSRLKRYARQLLEAFWIRESRSSLPSGSQPAAVADEEPESSPVPLPVPEESSELVEPLSRRELEILRLICEGCSNQDIAGRLVITLHTVKKHTSNIFSKLGVTSRTQAAARAHQLKII